MDDSRSANLTRASGRLPTGLRVAGIVSAVVGILGSLAVVYLVATAEEFFFGSLVDPSNKDGYYLLSWMTVVACGAQLFALVANDISKVRVATILRIVALVIPMIVTPAFGIGFSVNLFSLLHLAISGAILYVIRR